MSRPAASSEHPRSRDSPQANQLWRRPGSKLPVTLLVSAILAVPCFWQPRLQAGDLSSHVYNAWLARLISQGIAPGLIIVPLWTNTLFEIVETWLQGVFTPAAAERIGTCAAVLIFFWGAFALVSALSGLRAWSIAPVVAMLAYGFVFHLGLTDFYISAGLSMIAFALVWRGGIRNWLFVVPIALLACLAQVTAPMWVGGLAAYAFVARKLSFRFHIPLFVLSVIALFAIREYWVRHFESLWSARQALSVTGADQLWIFGRQYALISLAVLLLWAVLAFEDRSDWRNPSLRISAQLYLLSASAVLILPRTITLWDFQVPFCCTYNRMSLVTAVLACAIAAHAKPRRWHVIAFSVIAAWYFFFLYLDVCSFNRIEAKMESLVSRLPPRQRVLALLPLPSSRDTDMNFGNRLESSAANSISRFPLARRALQVFPECRLSLERMIDRVCIGRCFSYADYEPSTHQFRVRAAPGNRIVEWDADQDAALLNGYYVVKPADLPIYQIYRCGTASTDLCIRALKPGEINGSRSTP